MSTGHWGVECSNMEFMNKQTFKLISVFIIGVIIGGGSVWSWFGQSALAPEVKEEAPLEVTEESIIGKTNTFINQELSKNAAIHVSNQPSGNSVVIDKVTLEEGGWVVIHEGTEGSIGNALGAVRLDAGEHQVKVDLLRATVEGVIYRAVLYRDNGDRQFNLDSDFPVIDSTGGPVVTMFVTTN